MKPLNSFLLLSGCLLLSSPLWAQPPARPNEPRNESRAAPDANSFVTRLMTLDKNKDGKLTKSEVTDQRLQALVERADADRNGEVSKDELTTLFAKEAATLGQGGRGGPPPGGGPQDGRGGPPPGGGPQGGRGDGGPPQPGQILPPHLRESLNLSAEQRKQLDELQRDVDSRLSKILTEEQRRQLQESRQRGPGGRGPGGPGGPGPNDRPPQVRPERSQN